MGRLRRNWRWAAGAVIVAAGAIGGWVGWLAPTGALSMDGNRYGTVRLVKPDGDERGTVIMFSGRDGWSAADQAAATALAQAGALVAGVDSRVYSDRLTQVDKTCHVLIGDAEALSREVQRLHGTQGYRSPILFGVGDGAALAEITLAQARPNTIAGAVSLDMDTPSVAAQACVDPATMKVDPQAAEHGPGTLQGFWTAGFRPSAPDAGRQLVARWEAAGTPVDVQQRAAGSSEADAAVALVTPRLPPASPAVKGDTVAALPLIEMPSPQPTDRMAIVLSGDGGWRDIDKTVAEAMQASGVSVVGWDSLRYFWHAKTPEDVARALALVIQTYSTRWHAKHIALVGYSFGADVLPFAYNRLPPDLQAKVTLISLLGFTKAADFEINVTGWLGAPPTSAALPSGGEVSQISGRLIQCFYGEDESDSACPALAAKGVEVFRTQGAHHFGGDYAGLARRIVAALAERSS